MSEVLEDWYLNLIPACPFLRGDHIVVYRDTFFKYVFVPKFWIRVKRES